MISFVLFFPRGIVGHASCSSVTWDTVQ